MEVAPAVQTGVGQEREIAHVPATSGPWTLDDLVLRPEVTRYIAATGG